MPDSSLPPTTPLTHYVAVRRDLPRGVLAAQIVHAAGESSPGELAPGTYAVVLGVTPAELAELEARLVAGGVAHAAVRETDPPFTGQLMAVGIEPCDRARLRRYVSSLPLLRETPSS